MERPLKDHERMIVGRHKQRRDHYLAKAREEDVILNELALLIGGDGCRVDVNRGVVVFPDGDED